ncbi:Hypothetical_protein [Hexamita inflata]|uniref:Hypothetical_protein n=1 Tax=Hexamita inflata TaxID=28002 RepID=A0AA86PN15_9EUKA|nr:Hypothetical protein HINF_LOCUS26065 [Hexamita inflata]
MANTINMEKVEIANGFFLLVVIVIQVYQKFLDNIFSDSVNSHISKIVQIGSVSKIATNFIQGFMLHVKLNAQNYSAKQIARMFVLTYIQQQIPLSLTQLLLSSLKDYQHSCSHESIHSAEFYQYPIMFGSGNSCGSVIHQVTSISFIILYITFINVIVQYVNALQNNTPFILFLKKLYDVNAARTFYTVNFIIWFSVQFIIVTKLSIKMRTHDLSVLLNVTIDGGSMYAGLLCAHEYFGIFPMRSIQSTPLYMHIIKRIPKNHYLFYMIILIISLFVINMFLCTSNSYFIFKHFIFRIIFYFIVSLIVALLLCSEKHITLKISHQLHFYGFKCLLISEIVTFLLKKQIGDIKIGPQNGAVVALVGTGTVGVVLWAMKSVNFVFGDLIRQFE